jgi:hypothetical protein
MQVHLVCKKELDHVTLRNEYPFHFDPKFGDCDGYIYDDRGWEHWMELPSNSNRYGNDHWKSSEYFAEVVIDPEH